MIKASLAGLPKEYALIRTVILAGESSITRKEFRAQFLAAEEIEEETNVLSHNLFALYIQGSNSYQGSYSASGSNLTGHKHLSATIEDARPQFGQNGGNNYRSNGGNKYRSNGGFKWKNFNVRSSGFSSSNSRQNGYGIWSSNTKNRSNVVIECQMCNKRGHTTVNCFHKNSNSPSTGYMLECQIYEKIRHSALECYHMGNYAHQGQPPPPSLNVMAA